MVLSQTDLDNFIIALPTQRVCFASLGSFGSVWHAYIAFIWKFAAWTDSDEEEPIQSCGLPVRAAWLNGWPPAARTCSKVPRWGMEPTGWWPWKIVARSLENWSVCEDLPLPPRTVWCCQGGGTPWRRRWTCKNCRPAAFVSAVGQCAEPQEQPGAARHTRMRHSACTSAAFADNGKWRNPQCKKHADRCGRWVNGSIITTIGTTGVDAAGRLPERQNLWSTVDCRRWDWCPGGGNLEARDSAKIFGELCGSGEMSWLRCARAVSLLRPGDYLVHVAANDNYFISASEYQAKYVELGTWTADVALGVWHDAPPHSSLLPCLQKNLVSVC